MWQTEDPRLAGILLGVRIVELSCRVEKIRNGKSCPNAGGTVETDQSVTYACNDDILPNLPDPKLANRPRGVPAPRYRYHLQGRAVLKCNKDGSWNRPKPTCQTPSCYVPGWQDYYFGDSTNPKCTQDWASSKSMRDVFAKEFPDESIEQARRKCRSPKRLGRNYTFCLGNATFDFKCEHVKECKKWRNASCSYPKITGARKREKIVNGAKVATYECQPGYERSQCGVNELRCTTGTTWRELPITCIPVEGGQGKLSDAGERRADVPEKQRKRSLLRKVVIVIIVVGIALLVLAITVVTYYFCTNVVCKSKEEDGERKKKKEHKFSTEGDQQEVVVDNTWNKIRTSDEFFQQESVGHLSVGHDFQYRQTESEQRAVEEARMALANPFPRRDMDTGLPGRRSTMRRESPRFDRRMSRRMSRRKSSAELRDKTGRRKSSAELRDKSGRRKSSAELREKPRKVSKESKQSDTMLKGKQRRRSSRKKKGVS